MDHATKNEILRKIKELEELDMSKDEPFEHMVNPRSEQILKAILTPVLAEEGYSPNYEIGPLDHGPDLIAERPADDGTNYLLGVTQQHYDPGVPLSGDVVRNSVSAMEEIGLDRVVVVVNTVLSDVAREAANEAAPGTIQLFDPTALRVWIGGIGVESDFNRAEFEHVIKIISNKCAQMIADDPRHLDKMDWLQVERLVADLFDGIGFKVTPTRETKDGGKDAILKFHVDGKERSYFVEVKHNRCGKRIGGGGVQKFVSVVMREKQDGGLLLSTSGFTRNALEALTEFQRKTVRVAGENKIVDMCRTYVRVQSGLYSPTKSFEELLFDGTR